MKEKLVSAVRKYVPHVLQHSLEQGYRCVRAFAVNVRYGFPARKLNIIGVTGTNGKTTTSVFINEVLKAAGKKTALFTTAIIELNGEEQPNELNRTVPLTKELFGFFKSAKKAKVDWVVMEVTSHALDQHKFDFVPFEVAVITNLTQDHLDYHGTMEKYAEAKARILKKNPKFAVLNRDDEWYDFFAARAKKSFTQSFGTDDRSVLDMQELHSDLGGSRFALVGHPVDDKTYRVDIHTHLLGQFNAYNAAAAVAVGRALALPDEDIQKGVEAVTLVPGRMEVIESPKNFTTIVDYAHAADALRSVLTTLRSLGVNDISLVFGATGDRDKAKRPIMGRVAAENADHIYLTDDEPYTEDPAAIRAEVLKGISKAGGDKKTVEVADRREAIQTAIKNAKANSVVLITGMGHEKFRIVGTEHQPWDERAIVRAELKN